MDRYGIATSGNWIVDRVKMVSHWPDEETLSFINSEQRGTGGGAYNSVIDLHNLGVDFPLMGIGCIGDDADGAWIRADLSQRGIRQDWIRTHPTVPTSYTDVFSVEATKRRTFFHCAGAGAELGPEDWPYDDVPARVIHLAYLLVLQKLDQPDAEYGSVGARVLSRLKDTGITTVLDIISEDSPRVPQIVVPALRYADCLVCNEFEAGVVTGIPTRVRAVHAGADAEHPQPQVTSYLSPDGVRAAARKLIEMGVRERVVIHMPEGGYALCRSGEERFQPSLRVPQDFIVGTAGAGYAFAAGVLYGLHEGWDLARTLRLAVATAASCLRHATCTAGVGRMDEVLGLLDRFPLREAVI
ncbi:MAG: carbohydrate kinase family protein [Armatimonadetes bacterium]|nr:carbohydrate kinase family protein [Armatimonadota bacterium]